MNIGYKNYWCMVVLLFFLFLLKGNISQPLNLREMTYTVVVFAVIASLCILIIRRCGYRISYSIFPNSYTWTWNATCIHINKYPIKFVMQNNIFYLAYMQSNGGWKRNSWIERLNFKCTKMWRLSRHKQATRTTNGSNHQILKNKYTCILSVLTFLQRFIYDNSPQNTFC